MTIKFSFLRDSDGYMKKILFICDPLDTFKLQTDATYMLMVAASDLGFSIFYCLPNQVYAQNNQALAIATPLTILATSTQEPGHVMPWYSEQHSLPLVGTQLNAFDLVMVRNDPPFDLEYYYLTQLMTIAERSGVSVINNSFALRNYNEKLAILNFPELIPTTVVTKNRGILHDFLHTHGECVVKPLNLMAGRGIFKLSLNDVNYDAILESSTNYYTETVMLQQFIPEVVHGDHRIFIVHGKVIEHCLWRIPQDNKIRGNIAAGGRGEVHPLTAEDYQIAAPIAKWLQENNIVFSGIDVIGNKLTEINITSPTGTRQIFRHAGIDIPKLILQPYN